MENEIEKGYRPFIDVEHFFTPKEERKEFKNLDFKKAYQIIENEKDNIDYVIGGLAEDWEYTKGTIFTNGKYVEKDENNFETPYFSSYWTTPSIEISYKNSKSKMIKCYKESNKCYCNIPKWWQKNNLLDKEAK